MDAVQSANGAALFYRGGQAGQFIRVTAVGDITAGRYEGALPCITDADFTATHIEAHGSFEEALRRVLEIGGLPLLAAYTGLPLG